MFGGICRGEIKTWEAHQEQSKLLQKSEIELKQKLSMEEIKSKQLQSEKKTISVRHCFTTGQVGTSRTDNLKI